MPNDVRLSKFLSLILRHDPGRVGLELDSEGWADVDALLAAARRHSMRMTEADLRRVVATNSKRRFSLDDSNRRIRANQGHSIDVDLGLVAVEPPPELLHGTAQRSLPSILANGLEPRSRRHVHLSLDVATATAVGRRHGSPAVLVVDARRMVDDGYEFFVSANGVWLTASVPTKYLRVHD